MTDFDILCMYRKGYSINKIARRYKKEEKIIYKKYISFYNAKRIIEWTILTLLPTNLDFDLLNKA